MAGDVKVAVLNGVISTSGTGTADFTKAGFGPVAACKIELSFGTVDGTLAVESRASIGFSDLTNDYCITHQDEDASGSVDCDHRKSNTKVYVILGIGGAVEVDGGASAITDGIRLTNTTNSISAALRVKVTLYGGVDLKASVDRTVLNTTVNGTATITPGAGFDTSILFAIGVDVGAEDSSNTGINSSFGVCHINAPTYDAFTQRCMGFVSDHNRANGTPRGIISTDRILDIYTESGSQDWSVEVTAAATNSITLTTRDNGPGTGMEVYTLALDIDDRSAKVGSVDGPISGATWTPSVSLSFTPQYVGLGISGLLSENTFVTGAAAGAFGISDNSGAGEEACISWYNERTADPTNTNSLLASTVIDLYNDDVTVHRSEMSHSSFISGGWTYAIDVEGFGSAPKWFYYAVEEAAAGPSILITMYHHTKHNLAS